MQTNAQFFNKSPRKDYYSNNRHSTKQVMNSTTRQKMFNSNCFKKAERPFDTVEAINKFNQSLRDSEVSLRLNNHKNSFVAGWITRPT